MRTGRSASAAATRPRALAERLADVPLGAVASSDLGRARDTAQEVAERQGLEVDVERALREVDVGSWSGITYDRGGSALPRAVPPLARDGRGPVDGRRDLRGDGRPRGSGGAAARRGTFRGRAPAARRRARRHAPRAPRRVGRARHGDCPETHRVVPNACLMSVRADGGRLHDFRPDVDPRTCWRRSRITRLRRVDDYTAKYKGEPVEVALFGGEVQEGTLTAYCYRRRRRPPGAERPHPDPAPERRVAPLLEPVRRARAGLAAERPHRRRARVGRAVSRRR